MAIKTKPAIAAEAGLPGDPAIFKVLTEIDIIAHLAKREFERLLPEGLTEAQFGILNHLLRLDTEETISELAHAFQVTQPTMSSTAKRLINNGYAEFITDPSDARVKRVRVTKNGKAVRNQTVKSLAPYFKKFGADVPEIDLETVLPALTRLREYFDQRRNSSND